MWRYLWASSRMTYPGIGQSMLPLVGAWRKAELCICMLSVLFINTNERINYRIAPAPVVPRSRARRLHSVGNARNSNFLYSWENARVKKKKHE